MLIQEININDKDIHELAREFPEITAEESRKVLLEACLFLEAEVAKHTPMGATKMLRGGVFSEIRGKKTNMRGIVSVGGPAAEYSLPVEMGTKPHFPPLDPIELWVRRKLGVAPERAPTVAFLVARAISKRGTKAVEMFGETFDENEMKVQEMLRGIRPAVLSRANR